jgi:hypothetical protein
MDVHNYIHTCIINILSDTPKLLITLLDGCYLEIEVKLSNIEEHIYVFPYEYNQPSNIFDINIRHIISKCVHYIKSHIDNVYRIDANYAAEIKFKKIHILDHVIMVVFTYCKDKINII